jgi:cellulose synthase/poly-beta-1,6-N-acetylglucosamine synthase-like glycosyltransferase
MVCAGGILLVWIVYPALIGCLAARRGRQTAPRQASDRPLPSVSVIIATRDDVDTVSRRIVDCLRAAHDPQRFEVIVAVDLRSTHIISNDCVSAPNVRVVPGDAPGGKAATLNAAVRTARHELLLFTDAHQCFESDAIARLAAVFEDENVGAASGRLELSSVASRSPVGRYWSYERWLRRCEAAINSCVGATGAIWAMRRSLWGPLPTSLILDDVFAPMRVVLAGRRVVFVDDARATDRRNPEPAQEYRRKVRTLTGVLQLCCWLPDVLRPSRNPIWLQFMCHKVLRLLTPYCFIGLAGWAAVMLLRWSETTHAMVGLPLISLAAVGAVKKWRIARIIGRAVIWGVMLQAALVVATMNGLRREWDVWSV